MRANEAGVERVIEVSQFNERLNQPIEVTRLINANAETIYVMKNNVGYDSVHYYNYPLLIIFIHRSHSDIVGFSFTNNTYSSEFPVASTRAPRNYDIAFNEATGNSYISSVPYYVCID